MVESMLNAKPAMNVQDEAQLQGTQLGNLQKSLNIQQDQELAPLALEDKQLSIQKAKQDVIDNQTQTKTNQEKEATLKKGEEAIYNLLKKGKVEFNEGFIAKHPLLAERYVNEGGQAAKTLSADEKKSAEKISGVEKSAKVLVDNLNTLKDRGAIKGKGALLMSRLTGGAIYKEVGAYEALRKSLIGPLARAISGEVGVLTDRDIERAEGLLPKVEDDPGLADLKLKNLNALIKEKGGKGFDSGGAKKSTGKSGYVIEEVQ